MTAEEHHWTATKIFIYFAMIAVCAIWLTLAYLWIRDPAFPVQGWRDDAVSQSSVKAGGTISITRSFTAVRAATITVTRSMINGDCRLHCEVIDLSTSNLRVTPGEYVNVVRDHVIPTTAQPGLWRLVFVAHWNDVLGRTHADPLPELTIEVVK